MRHAATLCLAALLAAAPGVGAPNVVIPEKELKREKTGQEEELQKEKQNDHHPPIGVIVPLDMGREIDWKEIARLVNNVQMNAELREVVIGLEKAPNSNNAQREEELQKKKAK